MSLKFWQLIYFLLENAPFLANNFYDSSLKWYRIHEQLGETRFDCLTRVFISFFFFFSLISASNTYYYYFSFLPFFMALHDRDKHIATSILLIWQQFYAVQNEEIFLMWFFYQSRNLQLIAGKNNIMERYSSVRIQNVYWAQPVLSHA